MNVTPCVMSNGSVYNGAVMDNPSVAQTPVTGTPSGFDKEVLLATLFGVVKRRITYVIPKGEEYVGFRIIGSKHYQISCDHLEKNSSVSLRETFDESQAESKQAKVSLGLDDREGALDGSYKSKESAHDNTVQKFDSNVSIARVIVTGGKDAACCCGNGTEVSIFIRTFKKSSGQPSP